MRRCCFSQVWAKWTQALAVAFAGLVGFAGQATETEPKTLLPWWETSLAVKVGAGYKDNAALAHVQAESTALIRTAVEAIASHLPLDGNQITLSAAPTRTNGDEPIWCSTCAPSGNSSNTSGFSPNTSTSALTRISRLTSMR